MPALGKSSNTINIININQDYDDLFTIQPLLDIEWTLCLSYHRISRHMLMHSHIYNYFISNFTYFESQKNPEASVSSMAVEIERRFLIPKGIHLVCFNDISSNVHKFEFNNKY